MLVVLKQSPSYRSIRHLQEASGTDGKGETLLLLLPTSYSELQRLQIFLSCLFQLP